MNNLEQRVTRILDESYTLDPDLTDGPLNADEKLQMLLGESLQALVFVVALEEEFGIEFADDEVDITFFSDIRTIVDLLQQRVLTN